MAKRHHDFDVGMQSVAGDGVASGGVSSKESLQAEMQRVYVGEPSLQYQACNRIQSWGDSYGWSEDPDNEMRPFYGEPANFLPTACQRQARSHVHAEAWSRYLTALEMANDAVGGGNLKGIISNMLTPRISGTQIKCTTDWDIYPWNEDDITLFVESLCDLIIANDYEDLVLGWYLADESWARGVDKSDFRCAAKWTHVAQKSKGLNWPFYWAELANLSHDVDDEHYFWRADPGTEVLRYAVWDGDVEGGYNPDYDNEFDIWLNYFFPQNLSPLDPNREDALSDATLVWLPFYYPWGSPLIQWRYRRHTVSDGQLNLHLRDNPPWALWHTFLDTFRTKYPISNEHYSDRLRFNPVIELSRQSAEGMFPRHVDAHKMIRVLMNLRQYWIQHHEDDRFAGFCLWDGTRLATPRLALTRHG